MFIQKTAMTGACSIHRYIDTAKACYGCFSRGDGDVRFTPEGAGLREAVTEQNREAVEWWVASGLLTEEVIARVLAEET